MRRIQGVTIIELLVVVALIGFIASVGLPSFRSMMANSQAKTSHDQMISAIGLTRSTAMAQGVAYALCAANSTYTGCNTSATTWDYGWVICNNAAPDLTNCSPTATGPLSKGVVTMGIYSGYSNGTSSSYDNGNIGTVQSLIVFDPTGTVNPRGASSIPTMAAYINAAQSTTCRLYIVVPPSGVTIDAAPSGGSVACY